MNFNNLVILAENDFMDGLDEYEGESAWLSATKGKGSAKDIPIKTLRKYKAEIFNRYMFKHVFKGGSELPAELMQEWRPELLRAQLIPCCMLTPEEKDALVGESIDPKLRGKYSQNELLRWYKAIRNMPNPVKDDTQTRINMPITLTYNKSTPLVNACAFVFDKDFAMKNGLLTSVTLTNLHRLQNQGFSFKQVIKFLREGTQGRWSTYLPGSYQGKPILYARIETSSPSAGQTRVFFSDKSPVQMTSLLQPVRS